MKLFDAYFAPSALLAPLREISPFADTCMTENEIATIIVDAAYTIHKRLGPGLLESVYETSWRMNWLSVD